MMKYDAIFFDLDGTLLDTLDDLSAAVNHALHLHGYPARTRDEVRAFIGDGVSMLVHRALPADVTPEHEAAVLSDFRAYYATHDRVYTRPYEGVAALMQRLRARGVRVGIVSNKIEVAVRSLCDLYFAGLFDVAVGDISTRRRKPAPDGLLFAMAELGATPARSLYVGDSDVDIATARAAGIDCLSVLWGYRDRPALAAAGAATFASTPEEIEASL